MATTKTPKMKPYCPCCERTVPRVSAARESGVRFEEPLCDRCRSRAIREQRMDAFDVAYERAVANGWSD
jgi:hypothetical protein